MNILNKLGFYLSIFLTLVKYGVYLYIVYFITAKLLYAFKSERHIFVHASWESPLCIYIVQSWKLHLGYKFLWTNICA